MSGESEIRTHDTLASMPVFKTGALSHSAISPFNKLNGWGIVMDFLLIPVGAHVHIKSTTFTV